MLLTIKTKQDHDLEEELDKTTHALHTDHPQSRHINEQESPYPPFQEPLNFLQKKPSWLWRLFPIQAPKALNSYGKESFPNIIEFHIHHDPPTSFVFKKKSKTWANCLRSQCYHLIKTSHHFLPPLEDLWNYSLLKHHCYCGDYAAKSFVYATICMWKTLI